MRFHPIAALFATLPVAIIAPAWAGDVFPRDLIEVVHPGTIMGSDEVTIRVLALGADGAPTTGLELQPSASSGKVAGFQEVGEGWYTFRFTPPRVEKRIRVDVGVKGSSVRILVLPSSGGIIEMKTNPKALVLGRTPSATVTLTLPGASVDEIELATNAGEVTDLTDMGGGTFTARYTPPEVNFPHLALISAVSKAHPGLHGHAVVVLQGAVEFPVSGNPGESVVLEIEGVQYGPVKLDSNGAGKVPIVVSPGVNKALRIDVANGKRSESEFDLQLPTTRRLGWIPSGGVPVEGGDVHFVVRQPTGNADPEAKPTVTSTGGTFGPVRHLGEGVFAARFKPKGAGTAAITAKLGSAKVDAATIEIRVMPAFPSQAGNWPAASKASTASVVVVPMSHTLAPGSSVEIVVAAVDAFGYPVPGAILKLSAEGGSVPDEATADASGIAKVLFRSGVAGMGSVVAHTKGLSGSSSVLVGEGFDALVWPVSPGAQGRWERLVPTKVSMASPKPSAEPVPASKPEPTSSVPDPTAMISSIELDLPAGIKPGSKVVLVARALSANGAGVPGKKLDFLANAGTFSNVVDHGDGSYSADYKAPRSSEGELKITALHDSGALGRGSIKLDPGASNAMAGGGSGAREHHIPKLRLRAGFAGGSYQYAQRPSPTPGPLLPGALLVGGQEGGAAAPLLGIDANLRAWIIPYLGVDFGFRGMSYGINSEVFSSAIRDWLVHGRAHLAGRYPIKIKSDQVWFGVQAGFQFDDFLVFKGCLDPGCRVAYEPLLLPGLEVGASVGAEFGPIFFIGSFNQSFANATVPYRIGVDADLGIEVHKNVFIDLGFTFVSRQLLVKGAETDTEFGQLSDTAIVGRGSLGVQF